MIVDGGGVVGVPVEPEHEPAVAKPGREREPKLVASAGLAVQATWFEP